MSTTHHCPIEGCRHEDIPDDRLMCHKHWAMVPRDLQNAVYRWAKVTSKRKRIVPEHLQAVRESIEAVNDLCHVTRLRDTGTTALKFPPWFDGNTKRV